MYYFSYQPIKRIKGYKYITNDNNDIIVREYNILIDSEYCGKITSRQEFEIIKDHYYFYTNEVDVIDKKLNGLRMKSNVNKN